MKIKLAIMFLVSYICSHSKSVTSGESEKVYQDVYKSKNVYYEDWNHKLRYQRKVNQSNIKQIDKDGYKSKNVYNYEDWNYKLRFQDNDNQPKYIKPTNITPTNIEREKISSTTTVLENFVVIKKCCLLTETLNGTFDNLRCEATAPNITIWEPILYSEPEKKLEGVRHFSVITVGLPNCKRTILDNKLDIWFNILENGDVTVGLNFWTIPLWLKPLDQPGYCLDKVHNSNSSDEENERDYVLVFCELENFQQYLAIRTGFGILFMISSLSNLVTITIYLILWNNHSIHGWTQFSCFVSFFLYYNLEGSRIFAKLNGLKINPTKMCFVHAIVAHYFTLVPSGTSCMMSLDCFVTFWKLRSVRSKMKREFLLYILLSWGIPLVALIVGLQLHFSNNPEIAEREASGVFEYAHYRCSSPVWEFAFRAQLLLLLVNFLAFIGTSYLIVKHFRSTALANVNRHASNSSWMQFKKSLKLFLKLFLVTGISWTLTAIDLVLGYKNPTGWIFILIRAYLSLQGIIYMVIFGFHRKNFAQLRKKFLSMKEGNLFSWMLKSTTSTDRQRTNTGPSSRSNQTSSTKKTNVTNSKNLL